MINRSRPRGILDLVVLQKEHT